MFLESLLVYSTETGWVPRPSTTITKFQYCPEHLFSYRVEKLRNARRQSVFRLVTDGLNLAQLPVVAIASSFPSTKSKRAIGFVQRSANLVSLDWLGNK